MKLLIILLATLFMACSSTGSKLVKAEADGSHINFYSKTGLVFSDLVYLYDKTPINRNENYKAYIERLPFLKLDKDVSSGFLSKSLILQAIVDSAGNVETVFLTQPYHFKIDYMAMVALANSNFKPLKNNGQRTKYSVLVSYDFQEDNLLYPKVNGVAIEEEYLFQFNKKDQKDFEVINKADLPTVVKTVAPRYPQLARKLEIQGTVILSIIVNIDGSIDIENIMKSPHELLTNASIEAVKKCEITPAKKDGEFVRSRILIPFNFRLNL